MNKYSYFLVIGLLLLSGCVLIGGENVVIIRGELKFKNGSHHECELNIYSESGETYHLVRFTVPEIFEQDYVISPRKEEYRITIACFGDPTNIVHDTGNIVLGVDPEQIVDLGVIEVE